MTGRIAVVGSANVDLVTYVHRMPAPGETAVARGFAMGFGGKGANQAVAAARLGSQVAFVARVGDDSFGRDVLARLADEGIETAHVRPAQGQPTGVASIFVEPSGENAILIVAGANAALSPADVDAAVNVIAGCDVMLVQLEVPLPTVYRAIETGARLGVPVILNPAPAAADLDPARLGTVAWFCPNETELALLTGLPTDTENDIVAAARSLVARGIGNVVVTLGARGARLVSAAGVTAIAPVTVAPADSTGAGDAFLGAFAHHLAAGMDATAALDRASRYAALSVTRPGAQGSYATAAEFSAFCEAHP